MCVCKYICMCVFQWLYACVTVWEEERERERGRLSVSVAICSQLAPHRREPEAESIMGKWAHTAWRFSTQRAKRGKRKRNCMPDDLSPPVYASVSLILHRHTRTQSGPDKAVNLKLMARKKWIAKKKKNACTHAHTFSLHHTCYPGVGVRRWEAVMWRHVLRPIGITLRRETGHLVSNANSIICSITSRNSPWSCRDNTGWLTLLHFPVYMVYTAVYSSKCLEICMKTKCEAVSLATCDGAACRQVMV